MKHFLILLVIILSFCKGNENESSLSLENQDPDLLLLKLINYSGDVKILRDNLEIKLSQELELEENDLMITGNNGSIELLLGFNDYLKIGHDSEVSITNLWTTDKKTATNISLRKGKLISLIRDQENTKNLTLVTPNILARLNLGILVTRVLTINQESNLNSECLKDLCKSKLFVLDGNIHIRQPANSSDLVIEKNTQVEIWDNLDLTQDKILPLDRKQVAEMGEVLVFKGATAISNEQLLSDFRVKNSEIETKIQKSKGKDIKKKTNSKKIKLKNSNKKTRSTSTRDNLKLSPNQGF